MTKLIEGGFGLRCKSCNGRFPLRVEQWSKNLYYGNCTNPNHSGGYWLEWRWIPEIETWKMKETSVRQARMKPMKSRDKSQFDKLQIPYWKLMGLKAKAEDIEYEKMLKRRGMTYGDAVLERSLKGKYQSAIPQLQNETNKKY